MSNKIESYQFNLTNFDGPLDLLLFLVREKKINIFKIDLLDLANQYLNYISNLQFSELETASDYLVMATSLVQMKSRALLAQPDEKKALEKDKYKLLKELAEYQQFKNLKTLLRDKETNRKKLFLKPPTNLDRFVKKIDPTQLDGHVDPVKLIMILRKMFQRTQAQKLIQGTISNFNLSPEERSDELRLLFRHKDELKFNEIFSVPNLKYFSVTMIALLDLSLKQEIYLKQKDQFEQIFIYKGINYGK